MNKLDNHPLLLMVKSAEVLQKKSVRLEDLTDKTKYKNG